MPTIPIAVMIAIPVMVMIEAAMRTVPVAAIEAAIFMPRTNPAGAGVRRASPVAAMPDIVSVHGIPVAVDPDVFGPGADGNDVMSRRWRRSDLNSDRDLSGRMVSAKKEH